MDSGHVVVSLLRAKPGPLCAVACEPVYPACNPRIQAAASRIQAATLCAQAAALCAQAAAPCIQVAALRAKLDEGRADATRAQRAEAAVVTLQRQLAQARVESRATRGRARPGVTDAAAVTYSS